VLGIRKRRSSDKETRIKVHRGPETAGPRQDRLGADRTEARGGNLVGKQSQRVKRDITARESDQGKRFGGSSLFATLIRAGPVLTSFSGRRD